MANISDLTRRLRGEALAASPRTHWRHPSDPVWRKHRRGHAPGNRVNRAEVRLMLTVGVLAGLAWSLFDRQAPSELPGDGGSQWAGPVRVIDGDTFWAGGDKVRIADIDTPELDARCESEGVLAARATARLRQLLAAGPFSMEAVDRDEDRYGRKLRIVTRGGRSLGDQLVAEGLARTWTGRRESWC